MWRPGSALSAPSGQALSKISQSAGLNVTNRWHRFDYRADEGAAFPSYFLPAAADSDSSIHASFRVSVGGGGYF